MEALIDNILTHLDEGGPGSGFFKHLGRIGKRGGSLPRLALPKPGETKRVVLNPNDLKRLWDRGELGGAKNIAELRRKGDWWDFGYLRKVMKDLRAGKKVIPSKFDPRMKRPIINVRDKFVVDGTHRLTGAYFTKKPIEVALVNTEGVQPLKPL